MSQSTDAPPRPRNYKPGTGPQRYVEFVEDWLGLRVPTIQRQILEALEQHRRVVAVAANGVGKSYVAAAGSIAALYCNPHTTVNITSGSYGQLDDTIWKPIKSLHRNSQMPGRTLDNTRELKTEISEDWYLKCLSPQYPGDLEGRHNERMVYVIEEADKPGITREHIDSAESTITDEGDRMLVIANPPSDETNVVKSLLESEKWETLQFPSWESHNVQNPDDPIPGLVEESELRENWEAWNNEAWPGLEDAIKASQNRTDLSNRWYRRRAGRIPPEGSDKWRPWSIGDVEQAFNRDVPDTRITPSHVGIDVARGGGDKTVMVGLHGPRATVHYDELGSNHRDQRIELQDEISEWANPEINVDAVGEGSGLADELDSRVPNVNRFSNGETAIDDENYRYKWGEGLQLIGEWLRSGGSLSHGKLYEELKVAAGVLEFREKRLSSRGGKIIEATSKDRLKDELGRSPDYTDSLLMALHSRETDSSDEKASMTFGW